ncbi:unnamed protein product [Meganyctiphanes norvegica]|uniref:Alpha-1,3/1,6-mannosyltransferase ALG2 n=1 Tax=Meganyctiphanes norvegica TaxID=48144 RepID=A0AAV2QDV8_MEGNR
MVKVVFLHPDLGIGGAERLVVDAALALKRKGVDVQFLTAHHDPTHCFPETIDGQLQVTCVGDWLPRSTFGKFSALWAYIRMIYVALYMVFFSKIIYDVVFVDQVSVCIPFLRFKKKCKIMFYCHYPDQLLTQRKSFLKKIYRFPLDTLEEKTTGQADCIMVNSRFTSGVFKETFRSIHTTPTVLYPSLDFSRFDEPTTLKISDLGVEDKAKYIFLSLNRYERKKNLSLALKAFKELLESVEEEHKNQIHLIMAGGFDHLNTENIEHYDELVNEAKQLDIISKITFLKSPSDEGKLALLRSATCLIYTPDKEHFGIVPIEAMYLSTPVIAVNSGGPKETVVDNQTGFLCDSSAAAFSEAMRKFVLGTSSKAVMGAAGHTRVLNNFSFNTFSDHLLYIVNGLIDERKRT